MILSQTRSERVHVLYERLSELLKIYVPTRKTELHLKEGSGARVEYRYNTYKIYIGLKDMISEQIHGIPKEVLKSLEKRVLLLHEVAHIRFTDFRLKWLVSRIIDDNGIELNSDVIKAIRDVTNIIEDSRVNYLMSTEYTGFKDGLSILYEYGIKCEVESTMRAAMKRETGSHVHSAYLLWLFESTVYDMGLFSHYVSLLSDEDRKLVFKAIKETEQYVEKALSAKDGETEAMYIAEIVKKLIQLGIKFPNEFGTKFSMSNSLVIEFDTDSRIRPEKLNDDRLDDLARKFREKKLTEGSNVSENAIKELTKEEREKLREIRKKLSSVRVTGARYGPKFGSIDVQVVSVSRKLSETLKKYLMNLFPKTKTGYKKSYTGTRISKKLAISDKKLMKRDPRSVRKYHGYLQDPKSRNFVLILDCSGSMLGDRITSAKIATMSIMRAIEALGQKTRLIAFSGNEVVIKEYDDKYEESENAIASVFPDGCTELGKALGRINENDDIILIITDGDPTDRDISGKMVRDLASKSKKIAILRITDSDGETTQFLREVSEYAIIRRVRCDAKSFSTDLVREVLSLYKELMR